MMFRVGQQVMYIGGCEGPMPPTGAVGEILTPMDADGEHDVLFPDHPWPFALPRSVDPASDPSWVVPARNLIPIDDGEPVESPEEAVTV